MPDQATTFAMDSFLQDAAHLNIRKFVCETPHGIFMVDPADREIGRSLLLHGEFEYTEKRDWFTFIAGGPDKLLLEHRRQHRDHLIPLTLDDCIGRVIAFEPDPVNFHLLNYNITANHLEKRITAVQCALSNFCGKVRFERSGENFGDHRVRYRNLPTGNYNEGTRATIEVPCVTLDELVKRNALEVERIAAIKCDTQGSEGFILDGAQTLLQRKIPWIIEFWPYGIQRSGFDRAKLVSLVSGAFASFVHFNPDGRQLRRPISDFPLLFNEYQATAFCNLILLPS